MKFALTALCLIVLAFSGFSQQYPPVNSGELIQQAIALHDSGEYKKAIAVFNQISRNDTNYVRALYEMSLSCEADSQEDRAMKLCIEALSLPEQREIEPDLFNEYGSLLDKFGQKEKALQVYNDGIKKYPSYAMLYFNKGIALYNMERKPEAEQVFKQVLLINPFQYSAHYFLGLIALEQGRIIPAFLSFTGYLLINPEGKYANRCINWLSAIAKSKDEILEYKSKGKGEPDENFSVAEEIVLSKIALEPKYKPLLDLDDPISRQIQVVFEKLEFSETDQDFWMQYYVPFYSQAFKQGKFEILINWMFENVDVKQIQEFNKKNKKAQKEFIVDAANYFDQIRSTRELLFTKRKSQSLLYYFENESLAGYGRQTADTRGFLGPWIFYYSFGNTRSRGLYNEQGKREGEWRFYYFNGVLKTIENYKNGVLEGEQLNYFDNGIQSSREIYSNNHENGPSTTFFFSGKTRIQSTYQNGKLTGERKEYYSNGLLLSLNNYSNDQLNGKSISYYNNGAVKETQSYVNNMLDGPYKGFYDNGNTSEEGNFSKDLAEGEWKSFFESGKLKSARHFEKSKLNGIYQEYYENGQLKYASNYKNGILNGEVVIYDRDARKFAVYVYDDNTIKTAEFFDKSGKQISFSEKNRNGLNLSIFLPDGSLYRHRQYDVKGKLYGKDTLFYASGKVSELNEYRDDKLNGDCTTYFRNGNKKSDIEMDEGQSQGKFTSFFSHGQVQTKGWNSGNQSEGDWINYDELGNPQTRSSYLDDNFSGYRQEYFPNGQLSLEKKFRKGWLMEMSQYDTSGKLLIRDSFPAATGKWLLLHQNGGKKEEGNFIEGFLEGSFKTYYFDGSVASRQFYKNGLQDSIYESFYYKAGKATVGQYKAGKKTGIWKNYNEDGTLNYTIEYENDQINGQRIFYFNNKKSFEQDFRNDQRNGYSKKFEEDGTLAYSVHFEEDEPMGYSYLGQDGKMTNEIPFVRGQAVLKTYFPNGKPSRSCRFMDGKVNGTDTLFFANGQILSIDSSDYGVYEGRDLENFPNGKPMVQKFFLHDNTHGLVREYLPDGYLWKESLYYNGTPHGAVKYYKQGKLIETRTYFYGTLISVKYDK